MDQGYIEKPCLNNNNNNNNNKTKNKQTNKQDNEALKFAGKLTEDGIKQSSQAR